MSPSSLTQPPLDEVQKYDDKDDHTWTTNSPGEFPPPKVYVTAFVCDWRGVISSKSYSSWRGLGFSRSMLMNLSTTVLSALTACGNITSAKLKSDIGKELACSADIYCVMHGLIFKCWLCCGLRIMSRGSLRPRRGTLNIWWGSWSVIMFVRLIGWENKGKQLLIL